MTKSHTSVTDDVDLPTLGRALWQAKGWIVGLALGAGLVTFVALSMVRPLYTSEARILIQNDESAFTRPTSEEGRDTRETILDEQAVQSQVQVLTSRDLALDVVKALDLTNNPDFAKDAGVNLFKRLLNRIGLGRGSPRSEEEKAANALADNLEVFQLAKSSVIGIEYTSGDSPLAAKIANQLADSSIAWQRQAKLEQTKDATAWLNEQIEVLRKKVAESEAAVEQFRSSQGLYEGSNNVTLNAQQLSEINSQLILAKAQRSEAEARARLIQKMIDDGGDIDATPEVLKSELIGRLIEQRVQVQRELAQLSATLLPSHPRIKQLNSELSDVRDQIRGEATKIVKGLQNEAEVASARETSLRNSLNDTKAQASGQGDAEIKLRALEREAKANRDLLESYLARYRDASARHDMGAVPAQASIVSRAHGSLLPSFPKRGPLSLLIMVATALLALAFVVARELIGAPAEGRQLPPARAPPLKTRRGPVAPPVAPATAQVSPPRPPVPPTHPQPKPAVASSVQAPTLPMVIAPVTSEVAAPPKTAIAAAAAPAVATTVAAVEANYAAQKSVSSPTANVASAEKGKVEMKNKIEMKPAAAGSQQSSIAEPSSAAGLLDRLRQGLAAQGEMKPEEVKAAPGLLSRLRRALPGADETEEQADKAASAKTFAATRSGEMMPPLRPNDLRHYLNQRIASAARGRVEEQAAAASLPAPKVGNGKIGPVLKSLDGILNHIFASAKGSTPRAILVAGSSSKVDATQEAIQIARALVARREQVVLVDLTRGASAVSGPLGLPRVPGFTDLAAGRASFDEVIRIDADTPLQVIAAGNPAVKPQGEEVDRFMRVFEALIEAYDCVVLHADRDSVRKLTPALKFELPVAVVILPQGASVGKQVDDLGVFAPLGCPVLVYEQGGKEGRTGLLGRVAAI